MLKKILLLSICLVVSTGFVVPKKVLQKADKIISKYYEIDDFSKEYIDLSEAIKAKLPSNFNDQNFFRIKKNEQLLGYGYIGNAPSKTATYDYLVLFDEDLIITKSSVLIYREEYGGEIGSKRWLKQFVGGSYRSNSYELNRDIIPISGATISVRSMTNAINELLKSMATLQELNVL